MPTIAPGAEYLMTSAATAPSSSARSSTQPAAADEASSDTPSPARGLSAFDTLVGLATTPAAPAEVRSHGGPATGQSPAQLPAQSPGQSPAQDLALAAAGAPGFGNLPGLPAAVPAAPGITTGANNNSAAPDSSPRSGVASGQPPQMPLASAPPVADGLANSNPAAGVDAAIATPATSERDGSAETAQTAPRLASPGGWTVQGGPEFVGVINGGGGSSPLGGGEPRGTLPTPSDNPAGTATFQTAPAGRSDTTTPGFQAVTADAAASAAISTSAKLAPQVQAAQASTAPHNPNNPAAAAAVVPTAASQAGPVPEVAKSLAKNLGADPLAKAAPENSAAQVTSRGAVQTPATALPGTQAEAGAPASSQDAKPPVMANLAPASMAQPAQTSANSAATAPATAAAPVTAPAAPPAVPATGDTALPANTAAGMAQAQAAGTINTAAAEASPAGRFAQARQGVDERDGTLASARSKGKSSASAAGQAGAKHEASGSSPQPQSNANQPATARPDVAATMRDIAVSTPLAPPIATAPLGGDAMRATTGSLDPALTTMTNTASSPVRGGPGTAAQADAGQAPRFTPHAANQLAGQISQRFANGSRVFGIRLDPAELGRVDIRLELGQNNRVHATLTVERGDTLAEMQRSTRDLERALNDAGLELAEDGLTFQLSEGSGDEQSAEPEQGGNIHVYGPDDDSAQELAVGIDTGPGDAYGFRLSRRDGVDLRV